MTTHYNLQMEKNSKTNSFDFHFYFLQNQLVILRDDLVLPFALINKHIFRFQRINYIQPKSLSLIVIYQTIKKNLRIKRYCTFYKSRTMLNPFIALLFQLIFIILWSTPHQINHISKVISHSLTNSSKNINPRFISITNPKKPNPTSTLYITHSTQ